MVGSFEHRHKPFTYIRCREIALVDTLLGFKDALWCAECVAQWHN